MARTLSLDDTSFVDFEPGFLSADEADLLQMHLLGEIDWRTVVRHTGTAKQYELPRLQCWMSDHGVKADVYQKEPALPWSDRVQAVRERLEARLGFRFDYVLLNLYRDGKDKIAYHADEEADEPGKNVIASISLGAERRFMIKPKVPPDGAARRAARKDKDAGAIELRLPHGSLVVMRGDMQRNWLHSIPDEPGLTQLRVNLTFRKS
eukprot:TRINITY_DN6905_c0_g1_i1.p1 TRINITY_DN6905_c0_g1~~TRINITY_DN6905_c0_g1_i1.p1  ORF type:complete len:217 (-),score=39.28 TRINITY_DN6905_c0_g1_i1:5-625(-)